METELKEKIAPIKQKFEMKKSLAILAISLLTHPAYAAEKGEFKENYELAKKIEDNSWVTATDEEGHVMTAHVGPVSIKSRGGELMLLGHEAEITISGPNGEPPRVISKRIEPPGDEPIKTSKNQSLITPENKSLETSKNKTEIKKKSNFWVNASAQVKNHQGKKNENITLNGYHEYVIENQTNQDRRQEVKVVLCVTTLSTYCQTERFQFWVKANSENIGTYYTSFPFSVAYAGNYTITATTDTYGAETGHGEAKAIVFVR